MLPSARLLFAVGLATSVWPTLAPAFEATSNAGASSAIVRHSCGHRKMSCARRTPEATGYSIARWQSLFARGEAMRIPNQASIARAVALAPGHADVRTTEAFIIQSMGTKDAAIAAYDRALALNPEQPFALQERAFLHAVKGNFEQALKDYGKAVAVRPHDVPLRHARARLLLELGQPEAALHDLNAAIEQDKYAFLIYVMRAGVHQRLRNAEAALEDLNSLIYGPKGGMPFATGGDQLAGFFMQRALVHSDLGRASEAAGDMLNAARLAGRQKLLRLQVYLRQHGLAVPIDGTPSDALKDAIETCFRLDQCRRGLGQPT